MTTEIEKQFFSVFGIEPKTNREYGYTMAIYNEAGKEIKLYPQVTDRTLLELICIAQSRFDLNFKNLCFDKIENLKHSVLDQIIEYENKKYNHSIKHQVQAIFKGER